MKTLKVVFCQQKIVRSDWNYKYESGKIEALLGQMREELEPFGVSLETEEEGVEISIRGYADLLNSVRFRYQAAGFGNLCLGHVIGASPNRDLIEDLRRGINRLVFAPETIEPEGSDKVVCHNCGCGC